MVLLLCGAAQPFAAASAAPSYTFTTFDDAKAASTIIQAINKSGTLVGTALTAAGVATCFTYNGKAKTDFHNPKYPSTKCTGINAAGEIVGYYPSNTLPGGGTAFIYSKGVFKAITPPGSTGGAAAYGINDAGTVIGTYVDAKSAQHGFVLKGGVYKKFDVPGQTATLGVSINSKDQYSIQTADAQGNEHSFLYSGGKYTELVFPKSQSTRGHQINDAGVIAIGWTDADGVENGGVYVSASKNYYVINDPKGKPEQGVTGIEGINDSDTLVGIFATPTDTVYEGFIAKGKL